MFTTVQVQILSITTGLFTVTNLANESTTLFCVAVIQSSLGGTFRFYWILLISFAP